MIAAFFWKSHEVDKIESQTVLTSFHRARKTKCADGLISTNRGRRNSSNHEPKGLILQVPNLRESSSQLPLEMNHKSTLVYNAFNHCIYMINAYKNFQRCFNITLRKEWPKPEASPSTEGATFWNSRLRTLEAKTWASRPGRELPFVQTVGRILKILRYRI